MARRTRRPDPYQRADVERLARRFAATGVRRVAGRVLGDDTHFDARRDAIGWKPHYVGVESRPLSALSVGGLPLTGVDGSAIAAARAFADALVRRRDRGHRTRRNRGRAPQDALPITFDLSKRLAELLEAGERRERQLRGGDAAQGARRHDSGTRIDGERGSCGGSKRAAAGVPLAGVRVADGSGLSPASTA